MARAWVWTLVAALGLAGAAEASLKDALSAAARDNWDLATREARAQGGYAPTVIEWQRLRDRDGGATFEEYRQFLADYGDWPGIPLLRRRGEAAIDARTPRSEVLAYFQHDDPQTPNGAYWLALALSGDDRIQAARDTLTGAWTSMSFGSEEEAIYLGRFRELLAPFHVRRLENAMWRGAWAEVERTAQLVPAAWRSLAEARQALREDRPGVDGYVARVPPELSGDPGLAYERASWRLRRGRYLPAAELVRAQSQSAETLGRPEAWGNLRRRLARQLMRDRDYREAYLVASQHFLRDGSDFADLEWLSGYIALRFLNAPGAALDHFQHLRQGVVSPISLGRAGYWEGRAREALGQAAEAKQAYRFGAQYQTTYYGQLSAERGGFAPDPRLSGGEKFPDGANAPFRASSVYQAGVTIFEAGDLALSARFFTHLAESLDRASTGSMAARLEVLGSPHIQLEIGKRAASMGHELHKSLFPIMKVNARHAPDVEPELTLAIARRESEFNPAVISHAGARGLMQLMPDTARAMAPVVGEQYDLARLTLDPAYNARLGTGYLQRLRDQFGGATALVAAGYNAGPGRPRSWIERYGDPRGGQVDPVDWVEHIPFDETRNYVMRVLESLAPYRARLAGYAQPLGLSEELRAR